MTSGPGSEGAKQVFAVGEVVSVPVPLQVFMDRHEGWETKAGRGHPLDKGLGAGRRLAVGLAHRRFDAELFGQPAEPDDGKCHGQDSLEGADSGLEGTHKAITSSILRGVENFNSPGICGHFRTFCPGFRFGAGLGG